MNEIFKEEKIDNRIYYRLLKRVGLEGKYQLTLTRIIFTITMLSGSTFFIVPFLFYQDEYVCNDYDGDCNKMVCALPVNLRSKYLPNEIIKSLANYYGDMNCEKMDEITGMQQLFMIGICSGLIVMVIFVEFIGRKTAVGLSLTLTIVSILMLLLL
jgi:amino acid transporter